MRIPQILDQRKNLRSNSDKIVSLPTRIKKNTMETNGYRLLLPEGTLDYFNISDHYCPVKVDK